MSVIRHLTQASIGGFHAVEVLMESLNLVALPLNDLRVSGLAVRPAVVGVTAATTLPIKGVVYPGVCDQLAGGENVRV
jgi:hypothetical protein